MTRLALALVVLFALVALAVEAGLTAAPDRAALLMPRMPALVPAARDLTWAGAAIARTPLAILGAIGLASLHRQRAAAALLAAWGGGALLVELLKTLFHRPRPDLAYRLVQVHEASFPSGHAMGSMILYPLLGLIAGGLIGPRAARIGAAAGIALALLIGATRVLLDVHWASDVIAGWLLGGAIAAVAVRGCRAPAKQAR